MNAVPVLPSGGLRLDRGVSSGNTLLVYIPDRFSVFGSHRFDDAIRGSYCGFHNDVYVWFPPPHGDLLSADGGGERLLKKMHCRIRALRCRETGPSAGQAQ